MFVQFKFMQCLCLKHVRLLDFLFSMFFCFKFLGQGFECVCVCILEVCVRIQLGCARIPYVYTPILLPRNPNSSQFVFPLFYLYAQHLFNLVLIFINICLLCFVLSCLVLFYLFHAYQGFSLFEYHEHALMHKFCDAVR